MEILLPILIMFGLGIFFAGILAFLSNKFAVKEDERITQVLKTLSGANCGACGYPGCSAFAAAVVSGKALMHSCTGVKRSSDAPTKIVVLCGGGHESQKKYDYKGYEDCRSDSILMGGDKECPVGCMGWGDCRQACTAGAIKIDNNNLVVIDRDLCINCGLCISVCPKQKIATVPKTAKVFVKCNNPMKGTDVNKFCKRGCIKCGICVKTCTSEAIKIIDNIAVIDYAKCTGCRACSKKCPTKVLAEID